MKNCPKCNAEMEDSFDVCWQCNFSISENKIIEFEETVAGTRKLDCLRCKVPLLFTGNFKFHEGFKLGMLGNLLEAFVNRESFDLYLCPKCGKVEFFSPQV